MRLFARRALDASRSGSERAWSYRLTAPRPVRARADAQSLRRERKWRCTAACWHRDGGARLVVRGGSGCLRRRVVSYCAARRSVLDGREGHRVGRNATVHVVLVRVNGLCARVKCCPFPLIESSLPTAARFVPGIDFVVHPARAVSVRSHVCSGGACRACVPCTRAQCTGQVQFIKFRAI